MLVNDRFVSVNVCIAKLAWLPPESSTVPFWDGKTIRILLVVLEWTSRVLVVTNRWRKIKCLQGGPSHLLSVAHWCSTVSARNSWSTSSSPPKLWFSQADHWIFQTMYIQKESNYSVKTCTLTWHIKYKGAGEILKLTLVFMDPFRVAFTLSKSEFMHLRKWSDGLRIAGHGNPAWAKNCRNRNVSDGSEILLA